MSAFIRAAREAVWIADAHCGDGERFVVHADEKLTAFVELESAIQSGRTPEDCGARENKARQIIAALVKVSSITSSDVSTYLRHG
jgi:hypothetical protein